MFSDPFHKFLTYLTSPAFLGVCGLIAALVLPWIRRNRHCLTIDLLPPTFLMLSLLWLYLWSLPLTTWFIGLPLERDYPPQQAEEMPCADAICILGGGMGVNTNNEIYANMVDSADRVWHGARLYKAGKAPKITLTGPRVRKSTPPLLRDLGVPDEAFVFFEEGKNTEDEARLIGSWLFNQGITNSTVQPSTFNLQPKARPSVLLVTSAWHMRRAKWLFEREGLEVIPAACDYRAYGYLAPLEEPVYFLFVPDVWSLTTNTMLFKEHFAYWCYRLCDWLKIRQ